MAVVATDLARRHAAAERQLDDVGQGHLLTFYRRLDDSARDRLLAQIESVDWPEVARLVETHVKQKPRFTLPKNVEPAPWYPHVPDDPREYEQAEAIGAQMVRDDKVAAFTVAGGQGTRLGWDAPKGTFPATPVRGLSLFGCFAEYLRNVQRRFDCTVPWYIMTSPTNDADTRNFFAQQDHFGLDPGQVMFFPQAMMPAIDAVTGHALLAAPDALALSPNGHGGSLKALWTGGAVADMQQRGIEQISFIQVDNPIVRVIDPVFLGLHVLAGAQMSSKMLPKREPLEKLGNFCLVDGKMTVIEYSDLPDELAHETLPSGDLRFRAGSIAIHAIRVDFVESLNRADGGFGLPFHRADKLVPYVDLATGRLVTPAKANAVKLETFVFDALPLCEESIIYETDRADEFAPIKNATGGGVLDSADTSQQLQMARARRWLCAHGVVVADDAIVEISQLTAIDAQDLSRCQLPKTISAAKPLVL